MENNFNKKEYLQKIKNKYFNICNEQMLNTNRFYSYNNSNNINQNNNLRQRRRYAPKIDYCIKNYNLLNHSNSPILNNSIFNRYIDKNHNFISRNNNQNLCTCKSFNTYLIRNNQIRPVNNFNKNVCTCKSLSIKIYTMFTII